MVKVVKKFEDQVAMAT